MPFFPNLMSLCQDTNQHQMSEFDFKLPLYTAEWSADALMY